MLARARRPWESDCPQWIVRRNPNDNLVKINDQIRVTCEEHGLDENVAVINIRALEQDWISFYVISLNRSEPITMEIAVPKIWTSLPSFREMEYTLNYNYLPDEIRRRYQISKQKI